MQLLAGERGNSESRPAVQACNDWLRMGAGRSVPRLLARYRKMPEDAAPTLSQDTLSAWCKRHNWKERADEYDARAEAKKTATADRIMHTGLARPHSRVVKLKRLAAFLEGQLYEQGTDGVYHNVWLPDVKQIGSGDRAERVDLEKFNAPLIEQYRATLDDLAKETGGRVQKQEVDARLRHEGAIIVRWPDGSDATEPPPAGA